MVRFRLPLFGVPLAALALAACGDADVYDEGSADPASAVRELDAERAATATRNASKVPVDGFAWRFDEEALAAAFGRPGGSDLIVLACTMNALNQRELVLQVNLPAQAGQTERLNLVWGSKRDRIDLSAVPSGETESGYAWRTMLRLRGIEANILRTVSGPVRFEIGEPGPEIDTPASTAMRQAISACQQGQ